MTANFEKYFTDANTQAPKRKKKGKKGKTNALRNQSRQDALDKLRGGKKATSKRQKAVAKERRQTEPKVNQRVVDWAKEELLCPLADCKRHTGATFKSAFGLGRHVATVHSLPDLGRAIQRGNRAQTTSKPKQAQTKKADRAKQAKKEADSKAIRRYFVLEVYNEDGEKQAWGGYLSRIVQA